MRWRKATGAVGCVLSVLVLSGCNHVSDWSSQHHMRLYERFRLVAHHDLSDGHAEDAIANLKRALSELAQAKPKDPLVIQTSLIELGGMYLAEGKPKEALDCYNKVGSGTSAGKEDASSGLDAQSAAGKGFCFLKLKKFDKASNEFQKALQLYGGKSSKVKPAIVFPIDLCPSCCAWGLQESARLLKSPQSAIEFSMIENQPLPCECVTSRSILASSSIPGVPIPLTAHGVSVADNSSAKAGTVSGANPNSAGDATLQNSWNTLIQAGKRHLRDKDEVQAERYFKSAINLLRKNNDKSIRLIESLQALSFYYLTHNREAEGLPYLQEEIDVQRARFGKKDAVLVAPLCRYGSACMRLGKLDIADQNLSESLELSDRYFKDQNETSAIVHSNLSELRTVQQRYGEAELHARKAIRIFEQYSPLNKSRILGTYFTLTRALIAQNKLLEAREPMKQSLKLLEMKEVSLHMKLLVQLTQTDLAIRLKDFPTAKHAVLDARQTLTQMKSRPAFRKKKTTPMELRLLQLESELGVAK